MAASWASISMSGLLAVSLLIVVVAPPFNAAAQPTVAAATPAVDGTGQPLPAPASAPAKTAARSRLDLRIPHGAGHALRAPADVPAGVRGRGGLLTFDDPDRERDGGQGRAATVVPFETWLQAEPTIRVLETDVPVSLRVGRWKGANDTRAVGLSASVPLPR